MTRLLNRFAENLGTMEAAEEQPKPAAAEGEDAPQEPPAREAAPAPAAEDAMAEAPQESTPEAPQESTPEAPQESTPEAPQESPPEAPQESPPEAAHARRTMIGRSAEEVDHAPPRGRYAPVPAPTPSAPAGTLRWAAPAAALAVASAIVVSRVLRRRR